MASAEVNSLFSVKGRKALVTGGTSGIGLMISKGLVTNGAKVYVCGLESDPIKEVEATLNDLGNTSGGSAVG
ncbi:Rhamnolipids biosynthesis 3-oxoacyl-[acyl-carrier-protein] reductase [Lachnellula suecica]|uniref:Rhamnolipids biosynthesis 3-oxoacyl-[acyl-carrier-protein] reductase n=1 Tax=Lachnellula suecica TaxID=602035 RepID=A0A8T9CJ46_9HELO|nr:Rhamnolipids biosynthesis 3-oxoacyl-[acyl-carrier-protein] reductase [Lachnellula suecica]